MTTQDFLHAAAHIGQRVVRRAQWHGHACTWEVVLSRRATLEPATGEIYQGTSGIALFLGELFHRTAEADLARTAQGAMAHAFAAAPDLPPGRFGFYTGRVGIALAAARLAPLLRRDDYLEEALDLLQPMAGHEDQIEGADVMAGAAGAIPALIGLAELLASDQPLTLAEALGEHLIDTAHREPGGWSWPGSQLASIRHLTGYSHGAAGIGLALLELAHATGRDRFRLAAEMAFLYERQFFDPMHDNWVDLRHTGLGQLRWHGDAVVRQAAEDGTIEPFQRDFMTAWCHGAPGIGLSRLRAYALTGQACYRQEAEQALRSTLAWLRSPGLPQDLCQCHGIAGTCELPLAAADAFDRPELRQLCERLATFGWQTFGRADRPWPCGTPGHRNDPSLMVGEAGIGYFFLRLSAAEVPSLLLPWSAPVHHPMATEPLEDYHELCREVIDDYFGTTVAACQALEGSPGIPLRATSPIRQSPVETTYEQLQLAVQSASGPRSAQLRDSFRIDRERYAMALEITDFTLEYLREVTRPTWPQLEGHNLRFRMAPHCRRVTTQWDWSRWRAQRRAPGNEQTAEEPPAAEVTTLLYRQNQSIHTSPLSPLAETLLQALPATFREILDQARELVEPEDQATAEALPRLVREQFEQLYRADLIEVEPGCKPVRSTGPKPAAMTA